MQFMENRDGHLCKLTIFTREVFHQLIMKYLLAKFNRKCRVCATHVRLFTGPVKRLMLKHGCAKGPWSELSGIRQPGNYFSNHNSFILLLKIHDFPPENSTGGKSYSKKEKKTLE